MEDDKWERMDKSQDKHCIACPVMEYLEFLVGYTSDSRYQVCLCSQRPNYYKRKVLSVIEKAYTTNGVNPNAIHPVRVAIGGEFP